LSIGRHFQHPESNQVVDFPPGPLTIGKEKVTDSVEIDLDTGVLRVLSPTDCVKDRLSHYYHWGDQQCLIQAKLISDNHSIDLEDIREWSIREGMGSTFEQIQSYLG
jgi:hypothetical protein